MSPLEFIITGAFDKSWSKLGLADDDLFAMQTALMIDPLAGTVIPGSDGLRKWRWSLPGRGKRGGARVIYVCYSSIQSCILLTAYAKNVKENLTKKEVQHYRHMAGNIHMELTKPRKRKNR